MNRLHFIKQGQRSEAPLSIQSRSDQQAGNSSSDIAIAETWFGAASSALLRKSAYPIKAWPWGFRRSAVYGVTSGLGDVRRTLIWEEMAFVVLGLSGLAALVIAFWDV